MAYQQPPQPQWEQHASVSPVDGATHDFPPPPPAHRVPVGSHPDSQYQQPFVDPNNYSDYSTPGITPGSDNLGEEAAGGGIKGIAHGVASANERESGVQAQRAIDGWGRNGNVAAASPIRPMGVPERSPNATPFSDQHGYEQPMLPRAMYSQRSYGSGAPLALGAVGPAGMYSSNSSMYSMPSSPHGVPYADTPYNRYSSSAQNLAPQMGLINPNEVADDDDWGMGPDHPQSIQSKRRSFVPFGGSRDGSHNGSPGSSINAGVAGTGAVAAGTAAFAGSADGSGKYNAVPTVNGSQEQIQEKSWIKEDEE